MTADGEVRLRHWMSTELSEKQLLSNNEAGEVKTVRITATEDTYRGLGKRKNTTYSDNDYRVLRMANAKSVRKVWIIR